MRSLPQKLLAVLLLSLLELIPSLALAQTKDNDPDELLRAGYELRKTKQYQSSLELIRKAWELSHSARAQAQLGIAEMLVEKWVDAEVNLQEALAHSSDP